MKSFLTKILSFFLAVFILFSTSSFTVDMHFCCNKLVDLSILGKAKACKDKVQKKDIPIKQCNSFQEKNCCSSQSFVKTGVDIFDELNPQIEAKTLVFINTFFYSYINLFEGLEENVISFKTYRPPLISTDIIILNETFLI